MALHSLVSCYVLPVWIPLSAECAENDRLVGYAAVQETSDFVSPSQRLR